MGLEKKSMSLEEKDIDKANNNNYLNKEEIKKEVEAEPKPKKVIKKSNESISKSNLIYIGAFFSQSREAKKRGSYLEKGFRTWWKHCGKGMGYKQSEKDWLAAFFKYADSSPENQK